MAGIFVSYRRDDTAWLARHLFDGLVREFGRDKVFMDIEGGIARGEKFGPKLKEALNGCHVLLALIGPQWLLCERNGVRRLDLLDDWVRTEIASALQRGVVVVPVLDGNTQLPEKAALPDDLKPLGEYQGARVSAGSFDEDFEDLVRDLRRQVPPLGGKRPDPAAGAAKLRWLISQRPLAADQLSRAAEAQTLAHREIKQLECYKNIHDLIQKVEFNIQRPIALRLPGADAIRTYRSDFQEISSEIRKLMKEIEIPGIHKRLVKVLESNSKYFEACEAKGVNITQNEVDELLSGLRDLRRLADFFDAFICGSEKHLRLEDVSVRIETVRGLIPENVVTGDPDLENAARQLTNGIEKLLRKQEELNFRVKQHTQFQELDTLLLMNAEAPDDEFLDDWESAKLLRKGLKPPLPEHWEARVEDIEIAEAEIDAALQQSDLVKARGWLGNYRHHIGRVFFQVDTELKKFVGKLQHVNPVLDELLDGAENGDP
jgi:hypothetical protein